MHRVWAKPDPPPSWKRQALILALLIAAAVLLSVLASGAAWSWDAATPQPHGRVVMAASSSTSANTQLIINLDAKTNERVHLYQFSAWCSAGVASVYITNGSVYIWTTASQTITTAPQTFTFAMPLTGSASTTLGLTLGACGAGATGFVNVQADIY